MFQGQTGHSTIHGAGKVTIHVPLLLTNPTSYICTRLGINCSQTVEAEQEFIAVPRWSHLQDGHGEAVVMSSAEQGVGQGWIFSVEELWGTNHGQSNHYLLDKNLAVIEWQNNVNIKPFIDRETLTNITIFSLY